MKRIWASIVVIALGAVSPASWGLQESSSAPALDNGTIMYLELSKTLDAKKVKPGDEVRATLLADVLSHGKIVLRQDSKLIGHITLVQAFTKEKPESRLGVAFDKAIGKGGQEIAFKSALLGISPAPRLQVESISGSTPPYATPPGTQQEEKHYPTPKTPTPKLNPTMTREADAHNIDGSGPTDIEGLSLESSADGVNRIVVSFKRNVKLESGVRLALRVLNKTAAQTP